MSIPTFTADHSLQPARGRYRHGRSSASPAHAVIPALPPCHACPDILDRCDVNGWRPRAFCNACDAGRCDPVQSR